MENVCNCQRERHDIQKINCVYHQKSIMHIETQKCARLHSLDKVTQQAQRDKLISHRNEAVVNKLGSLVITACNDAKRLAIPANSWPSRVAASQKSQKFKYDDTHNEENDDAFDLQYATAVSYHQFTESIVESHRFEVFDKLLNARGTIINA